MSEITRFRELRRDGRFIEEATPLPAILRWKPATIVAIEWEHAGTIVSRRAKHGVLAKVVGGRRFVAVIELDAAGRSALSILNADGTIRSVVPSVQGVRGRAGPGTFAWFEPPRTEATDAFGVVFQPAGAGPDLHVDVDPDTGAVLGVHPTR